MRSCAHAQVMTASHDKTIWLWAHACPCMPRANELTAMRSFDLSSCAHAQVITASHDKTIRLWDLRTGKTLSTLTYHKKAIRALAAHPHE